MLVSVDVITPVELLYDELPEADILPLTSAVDSWVFVSVLIYPNAAIWASLSWVLVFVTVLVITPVVLL